MCWTCHSNKFNLITADEEITTYKIVRIIDNKVCSPYRRTFSWKRETMCESKLNIYHVQNKHITEEDFLAGEEGLHSFVNYPHIETICEFQSFVFNDEPVGSFLANKYDLMKCIIPKGAHYAINDCNEVISDALVPKAIFKYIDNKIVEIRPIAFE